MHSVPPKNTPSDISEIFKLYNNIVILRNINVRNHIIKNFDIFLKTILYYFDEDYPDKIDIIFNRRSAKSICSEYVYDVFYGCGVFLFDRPSLVLPVHFESLINTGWICVDNACVDFIRENNASNDIGTALAAVPSVWAESKVYLDLTSIIKKRVDLNIELNRLIESEILEMRRMNGKYLRKEFNYTEIYLKHIDLFEQNGPSRRNLDAADFLWRRMFP